jgi:2-keto-4-pentenoate hydratase/2-oxohepta-3-ene-1,7-dioic acid hydratase in catechol pathway
VLGYTCVNDVTARDLQKTDVQFTEPRDSIRFVRWAVHRNAIAAGRFACGNTGQRRNTAIGAHFADGFFAPVLVRWISRMMTLEPGD